MTDPKGVAWKVAFSITHKPNFKDDANARTIHKLSTKHSQLNQYITEQESLTKCPQCTSTDNTVEESPAHFLGECTWKKLS